MSTGVANVNYTKIEKWSGDSYFTALGAVGTPAAPVVDMIEEWVNQNAVPIYTSSQVPIGVVVPTDWTYNLALRQVEIAAAAPAAARDVVFTLYPPGLQAQPSPATFLGVAAEKLVLRIQGNLSVGSLTVLLGATSIQTFTAAQWLAALGNDGFVTIAIASVTGAPVSLTIRSPITAACTAQIRSVAIRRYSMRNADFYAANTGLCT
jgi:hypothetical protein